MISLPELRARNVTPIWQEAVAVVQELIQTVKATTGSAELLPDLEHVALIPNGDVVALPGSPQPAVPVRHAAVLLQLLIDGVPAPPELEQFISRNIAEPPQYDTVAEFSRNLAFFERPGRRSDVERLVSRAVAAEQTSRADEELRRLKERAAEVTPEVTPPDFLQQTTKKVKTVPIAAVAAAGVVVVAGALWLWQRASAPQSPASTQATASETAPGDAATAPAEATPAETAAAPTTTPTEAAAPAEPPAGGAGDAQAAPGTAAPEPPKSFFARAANAVRSAVRSLIGGESAPAAASAAKASDKPSDTPTSGPAPATATAPTPGKPGSTAPAAPPRRSPAPSKSGAVAAAEPAPAATPPSAAAPVTPAFVPVAIEAAPAYPAATVDRAEEPVVIFTAADTSVTPAVIVRPVLPKDPPPNVPPEQIGTIDVWVDERGDVTRVKLISPANRFHERMLVSAAKMWKFRPAYKDGRPVRYITRVRLTI